MVRVNRRRKVVIPHPDAGPVSLAPLRLAGESRYPRWGAGRGAATDATPFRNRSGTYSTTTRRGVSCGRPNGAGARLPPKPAKPTDTFAPNTTRRGVGMWTPDGARRGTTTTRLAGESRYPWWGDGGGTHLHQASPWHPRPPAPHHGYRIGVRQDGSSVPDPYGSMAGR